MSVRVSVKLPGGDRGFLNVTAPVAITNGPAILFRISVVNDGSSGTLTVNDCATVATASAANAIYSATQAQISQAQIIEFQWPCETGIVISSVPTGSQLSVSYSDGG